MLAGILQAGEYFGGVLRDKAVAIFENVDWKRFYKKSTNRYSHGYRPGAGLLASAWDRPGDETLLVRILSLAQDPADPERLNACFGYPRVTGTHRGIPVVRSFFGSLFTYTFAHFWIPFECLGEDRPVDAGFPSVPAVDWWENSRLAVAANRRYHLDQFARYPSLGEASWGASACFRADATGYFGPNGAAPAEAEPAFDCTVPPHGAIMSLFLAPTAPDEEFVANPAFRALEHYYRSRFAELWTSYGPRSSFDASGNVSPMVVGIEKGPEALGIEAYRTGRTVRDLLSNGSGMQTLTGVFESGECESSALFVRGRVNGDQATDLSDAAFLLEFLFLGGARPACEDAADANDDGQLDTSDAVWTLGFLFLGTAPPHAPFPEPGLEPTPDLLAPCLGS